MKMKKLLLALILSTACGRPAAPTPSLPAPQVTAVTVTPPPPAPATPARSATARPATPLPAPAEPIKLMITAPDGAVLAASFYPPLTASAPGVLLLHMLGRTRADWDAFARELQRQGMAALALDLRGHGDSAGPSDWAKAPGDVRAAWDVLVARPEIDKRDAAIVGASIGANLALIVGANNADVVTVVALSPGLDYHGLKPAALLSNFGQRPVLLVASQDDAYSYDSVQQMASLAPGAEAHYFARAGHGTQMFGDPSLEPLLIEWLRKNLGILKG